MGQKEMAGHGRHRHRPNNRRLAEQYDYVGCYKSFVNVMFEVVYLMFGSQAKKEDFAEYTLRIDPEFGIFWRYLQGLPKDGGASAEKSRISILLGMYFLSNY